MSKPYTPQSRTAPAVRSQNPALGVATHRAPLKQEVSEDEEGGMPFGGKTDHTLEGKTESKPEDA